jgi:hypothetical protein
MSCGLRNGVGGRYVKRREPLARDENDQKRSIGGQITFISTFFFLEIEINTILSETNTTLIFW